MSKIIQGSLNVKNAVRYLECSIKIEYSLQLVQNGLFQNQKCFQRLASNSGPLVLEQLLFQLRLNIVGIYV